MFDIVFFVFGAIVGSFLNVCIHRLPRERSIVWPPSACPQCKKSIRWFDNVPVLSFLLLRGRCRDCKKRISARYPIVEAMAGLSLVMAMRTWGITPYGAMGAVLFFAFIVITFIDFDHQIIPDEITLSGIVLGVLFSIAFPLWHGSYVRMEGAQGAFFGLLLGGGVLYVAGVLGEWIFKKEAMGGGDVKLMAALGAFLGWKGVAITLFLGSLAGALIGIFYRFSKGTERIPFGPFLVVGATSYMFFGQKLFYWYLHNVLRY